jgi:carboxyl-terminal processing protease
MRVFKKMAGWVGLIFIFFSLGFITQTKDEFFEVAKNMEILGQVYKEINQIYVDETNPTQLMRTNIEAILSDLDPYTNFYSESQIEYSKVMSTGQYSGIGAEIGVRENKVIILELFENGPADQAGLRVGDEVEKIDDETIGDGDQALEKANSLILGEKGSEVQVTVSRSGDDSPLTFTLARGGTESQSENVPYYGMATPTIGYILLSGFTQNAGSEVADAANKLKADHPEIEGFILDLRGNPGGRLNEAVNVSNVFIPKGQLITEMRGRTVESKNTFYTRFPPVDTEIPLAVLVNSRSASASEIVSGSIQDLDRGVVVGQRSFGKGLVQNVIPLSYNTQMKITIAKYYTPSGRCIQAIDYSHRNEDGSVGRVPDSLINEFKTKNGRIVYDGGGVYPDIVVEKPALQPVTKALKEQGVIFDFVTQYSQEYDSIPSPQEFEVSDEVYDQFISFVKNRDFSFETNTEKQLTQFDKSLSVEAYGDELTEEISSLRENLAQQKDQDLRTRKDQILPLLKKEIINRYYYKQGVLEASFKDDPDIQVAIDVLKDKERYQKILTVGE